MRALALLAVLGLLLAASGSIDAIDTTVALPITVASPNSAIKLDLSLRSKDRLSYRITLNGRPVIELSRAGIIVDVGGIAVIGSHRRRQRQIRTNKQSRDREEFEHPHMTPSL